MGLPQPFFSPIPFTGMFRHYIRIAFRNLVRGKAFSAINILGLALGMACSLLIYLWVQDERRVDNFHANGDRLYLVYTRGYQGDQLSQTTENSDGPLPAELKKTIPEVEYATGFVRNFRLSLKGDIYESFRVGDKTYKLKGSRAGEDFFKMFSYPLLQGSAGSALKDPGSLAVSRKMAELLFGSPGAAMGKTVRFDDRKDVMVTAVFDDLPSTATDQFDYLMNWDAWVAQNPFKQTWGHLGTLTYVQLRPGADPQQVEAKIRHLLDKYIAKNPYFRGELGLQRFGDRHLYGNFENGKPAGGRIYYVRLFSGVAVFILLIACINFMNLATARAVKRAKEVGVRKVVGSSRGYLIGQFMGEAVLLAALAAVFSLVLVAVVLPFFNDFTGKQISLPAPGSGYWLIVPGLVVLTGLLAGSYPALFLSSLRPVRVLKGTFAFGAGAGWLRKGLVVFQFVLSTVLIIATLVVSRQMEYVRTRKLGYDRENLLYLPLEGQLLSKYLLFKQEAARIPGVKHIDRSSQFPHKMEFIVPAVDWEGKDPAVSLPFAVNSVGYDFVKVMNLTVVQGRDFAPEFGTDSTNFLVNEEAVRQMGLKNPVGTPAQVFGKKGTIVGVIKDYHFQSLHEPIRPLMLDVKEHLEWGTILVRTEAGKTPEALAGLATLCKRLNPGYPFTYSFSSEEYDKLYRSEQVIARLSNAFAGLAIFISCLGLLGLAMFSAEQRTKEIGIRKVMGASVKSLVTLFSGDFLKLVVFSFLIAAPLAGYAMNQWLAKFTYKIPLSWGIFALAGGTALLVALLTVSFQAFKAALANPVESLRSE
jgi:ABC-type antimicrobial peptide transport system permease subunit